MQLFSQPIYKYLLTFIQIRRPSLRNEEPTVISYVWCYGMSVAYFVRNTGHWILLINRKTYCKSLARLNISHLYVAYFWKCKSYLRSKKFVTRAVLISNDTTSYISSFGWKDFFYSTLAHIIYLNCTRYFVFSLLLHFLSNIYRCIHNRYMQVREWNVVWVSN